MEEVWLELYQEISAAGEKEEFTAACCGQYFTLGSRDYVRYQDKEDSVQEKYDPEEESLEIWRRKPGSSFRLALASTPQVSVYRFPRGQGVMNFKGAYDKIHFSWNAEQQRGELTCAYYLKTLNPDDQGRNYRLKLLFQGGIV